MENLVVIKQFEGHCNGKGKNANVMVNNYNLVYDKNDELKKEFYIMYFSDGKYFYFSVENLEDVLNKTWYENNNYVATMIKENKKRVNKYLYQFICKNNNEEENYVINYKNGNKMDNRIENLEWITKEQKSIFNIDEPKKEKSNARKLPDELNVKKLPKYVGYRLEIRNKETGAFRDFFVIENHPKLKGKWESSKSKKIDINERYQSTINKLEELNLI
jgi:hypothetical protein